MRAAIRSRPAPPAILNLFAYTGGATLACAAAGAEVCHVDASRGVVEWAQRNARANGLESRPIRWIVEDCAAFVEREARRGRRYDGILLDPPSFGRGSRKEVWKIEDDLLALLRSCRAVLTEAPLFVLLSCHTPGWSPLVLANLLEATLPAGAAGPESGELAIVEHGGRRLPSGAFARLRFDPTL
jgi:23S rRNA (cytosine1962-C5)-methyltransferase